MEYRKRGSNYTPSEKNLLLEIIYKYQDIVENKETTAFITRKKRDTWENITSEYNASASSGIRSWKQLRHLYENLKQRSKRNMSKLNSNLYYETQKPAFILKTTNDKTEIEVNDGEPYKNKIMDMKNHIVSMLTPQVQLLPPNDDFYSGDEEIITPMAEPVLPKNAEVNSGNEDLFIQKAEPNSPRITGNTHGNEDLLIPKAEPDSQRITGNGLDDTSSSNNEIEPTPSISEMSETVKSESVKKKCSRAVVQSKSLISVKEKYCKEKLRNMKLKNRYLINKNKMKINKHKYKMEILKWRLKKIQGKCNNR